MPANIAATAPSCLVTHVCGRVASRSVSCFQPQPHYSVSEGCNTLSCCAVIFQLYDTDGDGFVTSDDVLALLRKTAGKALSENQLQQVSLYDASC